MSVLEKFKNSFKKKIKIILGIDKLGTLLEKIDEQNIILRDTLAFNVLKELDLEHKEDVLFSLFPKVDNPIGTACNTERIRDYLKLVQPVQIEGLRRYGGPNDGGYVMAIPPLFIQPAI